VFNLCLKDEAVAHFSCFCFSLLKRRKYSGNNKKINHFYDKISFYLTGKNQTFSENVSYK